jgi:hypothetical protein
MENDMTPPLPADDKVAARLLGDICNREAKLALAAESAGALAEIDFDTAARLDATIQSFRR